MTDADVAGLARELVAIPSHDDETAAGDAIESWLREQTDAAVTRDSARNVIARRDPAKGGDAAMSLALVGHHDVVPPDDSQVEDGDYVVEERDGRLYGRGSADMKGALAAAMCAFRDSEPATELVFASFVGEEQGGEGCRAAIDAGLAPDYAVVGEGSTGYSDDGVTDVAVAHKGRRGSTLTATGRAAHASDPDAGENAIYRASDAVDDVRDLDAPATTVAGERARGSVAVTLIEGGSAWNTIPDRCKFSVDERTVPGERADLDAVADRDGIEWTVDQDLPPMGCNDEAFVDAVLDVVHGIQDGAGEPVVKPHATDAGWLDSRTGTDCVVVGAAEPGEAHTADESVSLDVLNRCYEVYRDIAGSFSRWYSEGDSASPPPRQ